MLQNSHSPTQNILVEPSDDLTISRENLIHISNLLLLVYHLLL